jgi:cephalosporin hydroxylase
VKTPAIYQRVLDRGGYAAGLIRRLLDPLAFVLSKNKLKPYLSNTDDIRFIMDATKNYVGHSYYDRIWMSQRRSEFTRLANAVRELRPEVIVEIGTRKGGTLFTWCRYTRAQKIISIDLPGSGTEDGYPPEKQKFYKLFVMDQPDREVVLLHEDSHDPATLQRVRRELNGKAIDFLFIDGDHTLDGVKQDFEMYSPLVRAGGLVAFHDIIPCKTANPAASTIQVPEFWQSIKGRYRHDEFLEPAGQLSMGIGVLHF